MSAHPRRRPVVLTIGAYVAYALLAAVAVGLVGLTIAARDARSEPVHWGVYVETRCEPTRSGCSSYGTWTSDDGRTVFRDVGYDGGEDTSGPIRTGFRDFDTDDDGTPATVADEDGIDMGWIGPALGAGGAFAAAVYLAGRWGDLERLWWRTPWGRRPPGGAGRGGRHAS